MNLENLSQKELTARCSWCHEVLQENTECFGVGGKVWPAAKPLIARLQGKLAPMRLSTGREIIVVVPSADSEARAEGNDIYVQACCEACAAAVSSALRAELPGAN